MKQTFLAALAVAMTMTATVFTSCSNDESSVPSVISENSVSITFTLDGDWVGEVEPFTRSAVNGSTMTDAWVLDYVGGELQQTVHQTSGDDDFGAPTLSLSYGEHTLCFVTSAGESPVLNTNAHTLSFGTIRDTFWKSVAVSVTSGTAANQSVTMDRVVTKIAIQPTDEVPASINSITITPSTWYLTMDYLTGNPTAATTDYSRTLTVPDSYKGTTGTLKVNLLGLCGSDFTTNVAVTTKDGDNNTIGYAAISNAPMKRNRTSRFSGTLFGNSNGLTMNISDEWLSDYEGNW